jgi:predicted secreted Zn-dependent protease
MKHLLAVAIAAPAIAAAQVYRCETADGTKVFSDLPCGPKSVLLDPRPASGSSSINPTASLEIQHYSIKGTSSNELTQEIRTKGPDGWWGTAHTRITYQLTMREIRGECEVTGAQAFANSRVRLPLWVNRHEAPASVQSHFDTEFRSLDYHERGHVRISLDGAKELERSILSIPPQATCDLVKAAARDRNRALQARVREQQVQYDMDTNHGLKESPYRR